MPSDDFIKAFPVLRVNRNRRRWISDLVVCERSYQIFIDGKWVAKATISPADLENYLVGWTVTEGLLAYKEIKEINIYGTEMHIASISGANLNGSQKEFEPLKSDLQISESDVLSCASMLTDVAENWIRTGALHVAILFNRDRQPIRIVEDIGRHNAVDKVVGYALLRDQNLSECFIVSSGRQPADMVSKIARAGIPIVISRAATTAEGIAVAARLGLTLIGFAREDRFSIYTHPERIIVGN